MSQGPQPLWEGSILDDRYAIDRVLGQGGFGITYLAKDLKSGQDVAIKELAPAGTTRDPDGHLRYSAISQAVAERLRHQFTHEADILANLRAPRVPVVRRTFHEHATGYMVIDYVAGAMSLADLQLREGTLPYPLVQSLCEDLLESLTVIHQSGLLHRDIKPANILLTPDGLPYLIDFGSAREWHADMTTGHTVLFTPGYAPLEQLSERARRGPATDLYGLAATAYCLLTGEPPTPAVDRSTGVPLIPLTATRPDVPARFAAAIEQALAVNLTDRPQSAAEMRSMIADLGDDATESEEIRHLDDRRFRLQKFRFDARQDPVSGEPMDDPKPLRAEVCPVCREGRLKARNIPASTCGTCRVGMVHRVESKMPVPFCPRCRFGAMEGRRKLLGRRPPESLSCPDCGYRLQAQEGGWMDPDGHVRTAEEWNALTARAGHVWRCDACAAQYDELPDGRWRRATEDRTGDGFTTLYPEEWARVAAGLSPGAGNVTCEACRADFFAEGETITLLDDGGADQFGFGAKYTGRLMRREQIPWLAVGKESGNPGLVGLHSGTEFDRTDEGLVLVRTQAPVLLPYVGQAKTLENWHRVAQDLPEVGHEAELEEQLGQALRHAIHSGEVPFDSKAEHVLWRGKCHDLVTGKPMKFELTTDGLTYGGLRRKFVDLMDIREVSVEGDQLTVTLREPLDPLEWEFPRTEMSFRLASGRYTLLLEAEDFAVRLRNALQTGRSPVAQRNGR